MRKILFLAALLAGCASPNADRAALKAELKREILSELREAPASEKAPEPGAATGSVQGRLIFKGGGVADCRVKLTRLLDSETFLGMFQEAKLGVEFEARTDAGGSFLFGAIPGGRYRLLWQVPGDTGWIRRAREKPDAIVEPGKTSTVPDVELGYQPVGTGS